MKPVPMVTRTIPTQAMALTGTDRHTCPAIITTPPYRVEGQGPITRSANIPPGIARRNTAAPYTAIIMVPVLSSIPSPPSSIVAVMKYSRIARIP